MTHWRSILDAAEVEDRGFRAALCDSRAAQTCLLLDIVRHNADTVFGRMHRFGDVASIDDFRNAVPVRTYDDHRHWIEAIAGGSTRVLTADPVIAYEETGGTSSGAKLIPYTAQSLRAFRAAVLPSLFDLVRRRPRIANGKMYAAISPAIRVPRRTPSGIPIGLSDAAYLGEDLIPAFAGVLAVPASVGQGTDVVQWRQSTLRHLEACPDLSFVSVWSPTFWLELVDGIGPDKIKKLWPRLDTISCWADGASAAFLPQLRKLLAGVHIEAKGLLSTESAVTTAYGEDRGCVPAIHSAFLEFADEHGAIHLAHEVVPGSTYRVIVTTPGGLYRYDTQDLVRCVSHDSGIPRLVFLGRAGLVSDMVGEKLEEAFVASALAQLPVAARLVAREIPSPHYELWLDVESRSQVENWSDQVEVALRRNPQYAYARRIGQLSALAPICKPGFWSTFDRPGRRLGDIKSSVLEGLQLDIRAHKVTA
jgi:hypothetical protein